MVDASSVEIARPKNWQDFQRGCVLLYKATLNDPLLQEYGRHGQLQNGIDLLGVRDRDASKPVGIQCRRIGQKLTGKALREITDQARAILPPLTELIVATTADEDVNIQAEAATLTAELIASGRNCRVIVQGWQTLSLEISQHAAARDFFMPSVAAATRLAEAKAEADKIEIIASGDQNTQILLTEIRAFAQTKYAASIDPALPPEGQVESPDLHAEISGYRELLKTGKTRTAIERMQVVLNTRPNLPPYARYRIITNIGAAHFEAGRHVLALEYWKQAFDLRPHDLKAAANLALGDLVVGDHESAFSRAAAVIAEDASVVAAWTVLIQASDAKQGREYDLSTAPRNVQHSLEVRAACVAVDRRCDRPRWREAVVEALAAFPQEAFFKRAAAEARLDPILSDNAILLGQTADPDMVTAAEASVTQLEGLWRIEIETEENNADELWTLAHNLAAGLRFFGRSEDAARILDRTLEKLGLIPGLVRLRVLLHLYADENDKALALLKDQPDVEFQLMTIELGARHDPEESARRLKELDWEKLPKPLVRTALEIAIDVAIASSDALLFGKIVAQAQQVGLPPAKVELYRARWASGDLRSSGAQMPQASNRDDNDEGGNAEADANDNDEIAHAEGEDVALLQALNADGSEVDFVTRLQTALYLQKRGLHEAASNTLYGYVDQTRDSIALRTLIETTVQGRLMARAQAILDAVPAELAGQQFYQTAQATLSWNVGDVGRAAPLIAALHDRSPTKIRLLLWRIDALLRCNDQTLIRALLARAEDASLEGTLGERIRLARALTAFGFAERARYLAYRLHCLNRDSAAAAMCLIATILPSGPERDETLLSETVSAESMVRVSRAGHPERRYMLESDEDLRRHDADAISPDHPVARALNGRSVGEEVAWPSGGIAKIIEVKHKQLATMHDVMARYEERFPTAGGLKQIHFAPDEPGGMDEMIRISRERSEHVEQVTRGYAAGAMSLPILAAVVGSDPVQAMIGLKEVGVRYPVALGLFAERQAALEAINDNAAKGCVVDAATFHVIRRLELENAVAAICGPVGLTQVTADGLRARKEMLDNPALRPSGKLAYQNGRLVFTENSDESIQTAVAIVNFDLDWIDQHAEILPARPAQDGPPALRRIERLTAARPFDDAYAASGAGRILIADDQMTRMCANDLGVRSTWLQPVLMLAWQRGLIEKRDYTRVLSDLIDAGQSFISIDGNDLKEALALDLEETGKVGRRFSLIAGTLGGSDAEPRSHCVVAISLLIEVWGRSQHLQREAITGELLRALLRGRTQDFGAILSAIVRATRGLTDLHAYMRDWARGHFFPWP